MIIKRILIALCVTSLLGWGPVLFAKTIKSVDELEYATVLYDYYQQQYFSALVQQEYSHTSGNEMAASSDAQVLKGGIMLSYGMADHSKVIFDQLLAGRADEAARNRAWYYLAKLYYQKGELGRASMELQNIKGDIPTDIHSQYHYLATLINIQGSHLEQAESIIGGVMQDSSYEPYLLYNLAVGKIKAGDSVGGSHDLLRVTQYANGKDELEVISDRARHGLAKLAMSQNQLPSAWSYLQNIRTTGLYSSRALLSYGWAAINTKQYEQAIPALIMLDQRSIAIPEVQETKVLLPHLYESQGSSRKALRGFLLAERSFKQGISDVESARQIIEKQDVPEEFVNNLEMMVQESDWYTKQPDINYQKLTPFLVDLMASNVFQTTLKELGDLYALRRNLLHWRTKTENHLLVLNKMINVNGVDELQEATEKAEKLQGSFDDTRVELKLHTLTLTVQDQKRFKALMDTTASELVMLDDKIERVQAIKTPYVQPGKTNDLVVTLHQQIDFQLERTNHYINKLEPVMRTVINAELDKHEERMRYYWAQARLAKARLYDSELMSLEDARFETSQNTTSGVVQ